MSWAQFISFMVLCFSLVPIAYVVSLMREIRFWRERALETKGQKYVQVHLSASVEPFQDAVESAADKLDRLREQTARELHRRELEGED